MSRSIEEKVEIVQRWFQDNILDRAACAPPVPSLDTIPPSHSLAPVNQIRVYSFNTWGLPIAPRCSQRIRAMEKLMPQYDVMALQEMSHNRDVNELLSLARQLGYHHNFQFSQGVGFPVWNGINAPGLLILSRFPIVDVSMKRFPVNGRLYRFDHSDWVAAKGVGHVKLEVPTVNGQTVGVDLFLTHLHANYSNWYCNYKQAYQQALSLPHSVTVTALDTCPDFYLPHRVCQAFELARFVNSQRRPNALTLVCGDLNAPPYDIVIHLMQKMALLNDAYATINPNTAGYTCGAHDNLFSKYSEALQRGEKIEDVEARHGFSKKNDNGNESGNPLVPTDCESQFYETPKRIDYILYTLPQSSPSQSMSVKLVDCSIVKPKMEYHGKTYSLSDHHGVQAIFDLVAAPAQSQSSVTIPLTNGGNGSHGIGLVKSRSRRASLTVPATPQLYLDASPPPSPPVCTRSVTPTASNNNGHDSNCANDHNEFNELKSPRVTLDNTPTYASRDDSTIPSLLAVLRVSCLIVEAGLREVGRRRRGHWLRSTVSAGIFLTLTFSPLLPALSSVASQHQHTHALSFITLPALFLLTVLSLLRFVCPFHALLEFLVAQFPSKEEELALIQTIKEMRMQIQQTERSARNKSR